MLAFWNERCENLSCEARGSRGIRAHLSPISTTAFGPWPLVTGAFSGIGEALARQLAASGLNLVLVARRGPLLERLGREFHSEFGIDYRAIALDLTSDDILTPGKSFVESLGRSLHGEFAELGLNTTVLIVGPTDTRVIDMLGLDRGRMPIEPQSAGTTAAEALAALVANEPAHLSGRGTG